MADDRHSTSTCLGTPTSRSTNSKTKTSTKRTRVLSVRQSRTGCYTCKERRIKCDETHPECSNCKRNGRSCGGYSTWSRQSALCDAGTNPESVSAFPLAQLRTGIRSQGEKLNFFTIGRDFLCHEMHSSSGLVDQFWKYLLPQIAHMDPGAHAACVVLGSAVLYRRDGSLDRFSTVSRHYGHALQQIQYDLASRPKETTSLTSMCFLLVMTDVLMDRHVQALFHLQGGLALLRSRHQGGEDAAKEVSDYGPTDAIDIAALSLDISVASYAVDIPPRLPSLPSLKDFDISAHLEYKDLEIQVLGVLHSAYVFLNKASGFKYTPYQFRAADLGTEQGRLIAGLTTSTKAIISIVKQRSKQDYHRPLVLRMQCHSCLIALASILSPEECVYDTHTELFRNIILNAKSIISSRPKGSDHAISADLGLVQPLSFTAMKCREFETRSAALEMLKQCGTDGPFDARVLAAVSRRAIELETLQDKLTYGVFEPLSSLVPEYKRISGCGPDLGQVRRAGDVQVSVFFSRCVNVPAMMAEHTPQGFEKSIHWEVWTDSIPLDDD